jgi:DNA-binding CsgD family transcriptional regulator
MNLSYRTMQARDCQESLGLLPDDGAISCEVRDKLPGLWRKLLSDGALNAIVVYDIDRPAGQQLLQIGMSVFVTDSFLAELKKSAPRWLAATVYERHISGDSPILMRAQVARANALGTLNLVVLHGIVKYEGLTDAEKRGLDALGPETFFLVHAGFQIAEIVIQPPEERFRAFSLSSGFKERLTWGPEGEEPLIGITRAEAESEPGQYISRLFVFQPPRFGFTEREQEVLVAALRMITDETIARELCIALVTVKSRWRTIYDKIGVIFESADVGSLRSSPKSDISRSSEKRRFVLAYVRLHPEELRPFDASLSG